MAEKLFPTTRDVRRAICTTLHRDEDTDVLTLREAAEAYLRLVEMPQRRRNRQAEQIKRETEGGE